MNILITQRRSRNVHGDWIDCLEDSYVRYFEAFGLNLYPVPNVTGNPERFFDSLSPAGIILSGGGDVSPQLYCGRSCDGAGIGERDILESKLLELAIGKGLPVLGICRGMQFINVYFGGRLVQDIGKDDRQKLHKTPGSHGITVLHKGLIEMLGDRTVFETNSYHNQGVRREDLAKDISPFAEFSDLDLVEGIYHRGYPIAGIQWHPERPDAPAELDRVLMQCFLKRQLFWSKTT